MSSEPVIEIDNLHKSYRTSMQARRINAVNGISFIVERGEVFGFLGPNGAGKTTTIRILMGLISATSGSASIFGHTVPSRNARMHLGFLPEAPYFYEYLTTYEMLDLAGRLFGIERRVRQRRAEELIERVGLSYVRGTPLKKFSKGMLQRAGIAQALINDPELIVLDEPLSGLDPNGRKDVLDVIKELRRQKKTVFFSSHILTDVEHISDRVAIMAAGEMRKIGTLEELLIGAKQRTSLCLRVPEGMSDSTLSGIAIAAESVSRNEREVTLSLAPEADIDEHIAVARRIGAKIIAVVPQRESLEDIFLRCTRPATQDVEQL